MIFKVVVSEEMGNLFLKQAAKSGKSVSSVIEGILRKSMKGYAIGEPPRKRLKKKKRTAQEVAPNAITVEGLKAALSKKPVEDDEIEDDWQDDSEGYEITG